MRDASDEPSRSSAFVSVSQSELERSLTDVLVYMSRLCRLLETHNHHLEQLIVVLTSARDEIQEGIEDEGVPTHDLSGERIKVR